MDMINFDRQSNPEGDPNEPLVCTIQFPECRRAFPTRRVTYSSQGVDLVQHVVPRSPSGERER